MYNVEGILISKTLCPSFIFKIKKFANYLTEFYAFIHTIHNDHRMFQYILWNIDIFHESIQSVENYFTRNDCRSCASLLQNIKYIPKKKKKMATKIVKKFNNKSNL